MAASNPAANTSRDTGGQVGLDGRLLRVVEQIHEGSTDPARWPHVLGEVTQFLEAQTATFCVHGKDMRPLMGARYSPFVDDWKPYQEYYHRLDVWALAALELPAGAVTIGDELIAPKDFYATEFYRDFLRSLDIGQVLAAITTRRGSLLGYVSVHRSAAASRFDSEDKERMALLLPHVSTATEVQLRLRGAEHRMQSVLGAFDYLPFGVAVLSDDGHVLEMNGRARRLLCTENGLTLLAGKLKATAPGARRRLDELIGKTLSCDQRLEGHGGRVVISRTHRGLRPLSVLVAPLPAATEVAIELNTTPLALVLVTDLEDEFAPAEDHIAAVHGLSPTEARLAARLCCGESLAAAAAALNITANTARTHLKSLFQKTRTHRQAELVRLLLADITGFISHCPPPRGSSARISTSG